MLLQFIEEAALINFTTGVALIATLSSISSVAAQETSQIPTEFPGIWGWGTAQCSASDWRNVDVLHQITADRTEWWEATCDVVEVARQEGGDSIKVKLNCSGEGEEWIATEFWKPFMIESKKYLVTATVETDQLQIYRQCE
jgi:hypothetical protein